MLLVTQIIYPNKNKISLKDQIDFLQRFSRLVSKGYSVKKSLDLMTYDPQYGELTSKFITYLQNGQSIDYCFRRLNFHPIVIAYMYFSKDAGHLSEHIINCNRLLEMKYTTNKKINELLRYPFFLLSISLILLIFMTSYLLPLYSNTYSHFGEGNSFNFFYSIVNIFKYSFMSLFLITTLFTILLIIHYKRLDIRKKIELINRIPIFRTYKRLTTTMHFSYHLASLLQSGRTIQEALVIMEEQGELPFIQFYSSLVKQDLSRGKSLYQAISPLRLLEKEMKILVRRNDQDGSLLLDLHSYSSLLFDTIEVKMKKLLYFIQPTVYSIIGILIMIIYIFTLYPAFQLINQL